MLELRIFWSSLDPDTLHALALGLIASALLLLGVGLMVRLQRQARSRQTVDTALATRTQRPSAMHAPRADAAASARGSMLDTAASLGGRWQEGRFGAALLANEDRLLVDQCGFVDRTRARAMFVFARCALSLGLPLVAWLLWGDWKPLGSAATGFVILVFFGFGLGWMLPKWALARRVAHRRVLVAEELPLLIDLLRLLQGVGLSMEQSLHVIVAEFQGVMPVLGYELKQAQDRYARGVPREQAMARIATGFGNDDLNAIVRLIVQVEKHGGAVQEPLRQFGERVREQRKLDLKEKVGKLTVKMTGVMVLTLLPALLIVTGGAGFLALFRGLSRVSGG